MDDLRNIKLSELLEIYKSDQIDDFLKRYSGYDLNENNLSYSDIEKNYKFLGDNSSNSSSVSLLKRGEKGLVERITNAIDAVIEKEKIKNNILKANDSMSIIEKSFPQYYKTIQDVLYNRLNKINVKDASEKVILAINDGSKSNKPTFDVIDKGIGLSGSEFKSTILSLNKGNKLSSEKSYLIGTFGQGGSTSLPFTYATIILSKKESKFYFTIIKQVELIDYKNRVYVYLTCDNEILEVENDCNKLDDEYLNVFINSESGTLVRMIETDIDVKFRNNEITKPGMLLDYINTEMFNVGLPVKVIENRMQYKGNKHLQNRYAHGSYVKLQTSEYVKKEYCGMIDIVHKNRAYEIEYYILLPKDESLWGNDNECKKVFEQFNVHYDPIIYIVNGQTITTEKFTKLNNAGLNFLKYRLLVIINLDILGREKYKFFTTDRVRIVDIDLTRGFIDNVVEAIANVDKLKAINAIIAEKSINHTVSKDLLNEVSKEVKNQYSKYLRGGVIFPSSRGRHYGPNDEVIYTDVIDFIDLTTTKDKFYRNQMFSFVVTTNAYKYVNEEAKIDMYIDGKSFYNMQKNAMNGRIQYIINAGDIKPGSHTIQFIYFKNLLNVLTTEILNFEILNEDSPDNLSKQQSKSLDLNIIMVSNSSLICDVSKDDKTKKIEIKLCLDSDLLKSEVYGLSASANEISAIKTNIIKPIALFVLFYGEEYDNISNDDDKNKLVLSFIKSYIVSANKKLSELPV